MYTIFLIWGSTEDPMNPFCSDQGAIRGSYASRELAQETLEDFQHGAACFKELNLKETYDTVFWIEEVDHHE